MDEMNITPFSSSRPQRLFEAVAWSESTIGLLQHNNIFYEATSSSFPQLSIQRTPHDVITPPPRPFCKQQRYLQRKQHPQRSNILKVSTTLNPTHSTWRYYTPPPQPPLCKQQRYLQRNNIFNEATSSRFPQLSIQRAPHDVITPPHPPHPPSLYHNDVYSIGSRLRVPGSSGEPPALSLYIYIFYLNHGNIYPGITSKHGKHLILQRCEYINKNIREDGICLSGRSFHISYLVL